MLRRYLLVVLFLIGNTVAYAQPANDSLIITTEEKSQMDKALAHSTFHYSYMVDSCSKKGDSVNASAALLKISPYELFYEDVTPDSIDAYINRWYKVTGKARSQYVAFYTKAYAAKKSAAYITFRNMRDEDQRIRAAYEKGGDSSTRAINIQNMINTDSAHFDYLYKYVKKNGWPALIDGSLFATTIAIHDHQHYDFYFPYLKKAVLKGNVSTFPLMVMRVWRSIDHDYDEFQSCLETKSYMSFDVTSMFDHVLPASLPEIEKAVEKYCPAWLHLVIEAPNFYRYDSLKNKIIVTPWLGDHDYALKNNIESKLELDLVKYMTCEIQDKRLRDTKIFDYGYGLPMYPTWKVSDAQQPKLILYITYCQQDDDGFFSLIIDKKLTTHSIYFDTDSTSIKPNSAAMLTRLATWLNKRQNIKLEINGHTDNVGDSSANMKLSQDRANEVMRMLIAKGIDASRLTAKGYGATKPIQNNGTAEGKAENRRVEFIRP